MEDQKIQNLINLAVLDENRKELYRQALPKMTAEEKMDLALGLWQMWMQKLNKKVTDEVEAMLSEMAEEDSKVVYEKKDFQKVQEKVLNEMLKDRLGVEEEDQLAGLRTELNEIHHVVETHDREISEIKDKLE